MDEEIKSSEPVSNPPPSDPPASPQVFKLNKINPSILAIAGFVLLILIGFAVATFQVIFKNEIGQPFQQEKACTLEAKICPDGSSVGRSGPQCEFAACPSSPSAKLTK
jgi:hypothetical protein